MAHLVCQLSIYNSFPVIRTTIEKNRRFYVPPPSFFVCPGDAPVAITKNVAWLKRQFNACQTRRSMYPSIFNSFPVIRTASAKNRRFHVPQPTFLLPLETDAPAIITQYVAWVERQFNACQTPRSMYLSIFNSFRVLRCLSQCVSPKIAILPHFCFPWGRPWGNHAKCCMDVKRIRCLQIASLHVPIYLFNCLWDRARYWSKIVIFSYPLVFDAPVRGFSSD